MRSLHIRQRICEGERNAVYYSSSAWKAAFFEHETPYITLLSIRPALPREIGTFSLEKSRCCPSGNPFKGQLDTWACEIMNRTINMRGMPITFARRYNFLAPLYWFRDEKFGSVAAPNFRRSVSRRKRPWPRLSKIHRIAQRRRRRPVSSLPPLALKENEQKSFSGSGISSSTAYFF